MTAPTARATGLALLAAGALAACGATHTAKPRPKSRPFTGPALGGGGGGGGSLVGQQPKHLHPPP